jgi:histone H3/H4
MSLINKTGVRALAKSLNMKISADSFEAAEARLKVILEHAAKKAQSKRRKTILKRDFIHEIDLFDLD